MLAKTILVTAVLLTVGSCGSPIPPPASPADVARAQQQWPDATAQSLEAGRAVLRTRCSECHYAPLPREHALSDWPDILADMVPKAKLDDADRELLVRYISTMASTPAP